MSINNIEAPTQMTTDQDLVQIAGYHAYLSLKKDDYFNVNNEEYRILNTIEDTETGLDALTIMNLSNEEVTLTTGAYHFPNNLVSQDCFTIFSLYIFIYFHQNPS